jgi:hypothetical protein
LTAAGADGIEQLARSAGPDIAIGLAAHSVIPMTVARAVSPAHLACFSTWFAALWNLPESFSLVKLLFPRGENEGLSAVCTAQRFVLEFHALSSVNGHEKSPEDHRGPRGFEPTTRMTRRQEDTQLPISQFTLRLIFRQA